MEPINVTQQLKDKVTFSIVLEDKLNQMEEFDDIPVVIGGVITHHLNMSQFRLFQPKDKVGEIELIDDAYLTLDDGLGTINVCLRPELYEELLAQNEGQLLGKVVAFKGQAMRINRGLYDTKLKRTFENPFQAFDYRTFADEIFPL